MPRPTGSSGLFTRSSGATWYEVGWTGQRRNPSHSTPACRRCGRHMARLERRLPATLIFATVSASFGQRDRSRRRRAEPDAVGSVGTTVGRGSEISHQQSEASGRGVRGRVRHGPHGLSLRVASGIQCSAERVRPSGGHQCRGGLEPSDSGRRFADHPVHRHPLDRQPSDRSGQCRQRHRAWHYIRNSGYLHGRSSECQRHERSVEPLRTGGAVVALSKRDSRAPGASELLDAPGALESKGGSDEPVGKAPPSFISNPISQIPRHDRRPLRTCHPIIGGNRSATSCCSSDDLRLSECGGHAEGEDSSIAGEQCGVVCAPCGAE